MNQLLELPRPSRRIVAVLVALVAIVLVALASTLEPATQSTTNETGTVVAERGEGTIGAPLDDVGALVDPAAPDTAIDEFSERDAAAAGGTNELSAPEPIAGTSGLELPALDARIVRTAAIELDVKRGGFEDAWGDVQSVATSSGGYVLSASRSGAGDSARIGTITMRVPTGKFESALERLRETSGAKVGRLDVSSQDVTQEYVDTSSRLRHDRAVERRLVALLAKADGVSEVLAVQNRLDAVQEQIEVARGRLTYLDKLTAMSTIEVTIDAPAKSSTATRDDEQGALGEALGDARDRFTENVAGAVVWFGGALPALLALAVISVVARIAWKRISRRNAGVSVDAP